MLVLFASVILANIPITLTPPSVLRAVAGTKGVLDTAFAAPQIPKTINPTASPIPDAVIAEFGQNHVMVAIAGCESGFRQFSQDGSVLKNPKSSASGVFQIMSSIHSVPALKMGMDIMTARGNINYARYLYDHQGTAPWNASKDCWGR